MSSRRPQQALCCSVFYQTEAQNRVALKYRFRYPQIMEARQPHLQGIRAIAVATVVFYHLRIGGVQGGFIGVDVFFVLSGFLITRLLFNEISRTGTINVTNFWLRRAKRLLPNALLTLTFALFATWLLISPYRWPSVARDIVTAALFVSNFRFSSNATDYFHFDDPPSPILHYWSLSIEEQFYFTLPLLLIALLPTIRRRPQLVANVILVAICAASLTAAIIVTNQSQPTAFFGTLTRIWQLALGGILGINFERCRSIPEQPRKLLAWIGLTAIVYAAFFFDDDTSYPGFNALIPTTGTFFLILGIDPRRGRNPLQAVLSALPMRWIGDRSYSLYLWHWPLIVFAREFTVSNAAWTLAILVTIVLVSHLTYEWIERPLHKKNIQLQWRVWVGGLAIGAIVLVCAAGTGLAELSSMVESADRVKAVLKASSDFGANYRDGCHAATEQVEQSDCAYGSIGASHKIVLFGDSHSAQWMEPLRDAADRAGWELHSWTKTSCPPPLTTIWYLPKRALYTECTLWREKTIARINQLKPEIVVLTATSADIYAGTIMRNQRLLKGKAAAEEFQRGLAETIEKLTADGRRIVVIRDNPVMYKQYAACLSSGSKHCGRDRTEAVGNSERFVKELPIDRVTIQDFTNVVCDTTYCAASDDNGIRYQDKQHFTATFTKTFWPIFYQLIMSPHTVR